MYNAKEIQQIAKEFVANYSDELPAITADALAEWQSNNYRDMSDEEVEALESAMWAERKDKMEKAPLSEKIEYALNNQNFQEMLTQYFGVKYASEAYNDENGQGTDTALALDPATWGISLHSADENYSHTLGRINDLAWEEEINDFLNSL